MVKRTKHLTSLIFLVIFIGSCDFGLNENELNQSTPVEFGGDFSIMKKMEDLGGLYKVDGFVKEGFEIFTENGYSWARLRIFHTPNKIGPVCNDLDYTIELAKKAKRFGLKILLNFHYSDTWADPGHQSTPAAWENLSLDILQDSVFAYTKDVIETMNNEGIKPNMVQIGNEINNGLLWPHGKLWLEQGATNWNGLTKLLNSGIDGVRNARGGSDIPILIHAATGGDLNSSYRFYKNIVDRGVEFDVIGLSYYPWWHGTYIDLESTILYLASQFTHDFSIVETAYYSNGWYPDQEEWSYSSQPFPPTEQGQFNFLFELAQVARRQPRVRTIFYWKPDGLEIPKSKVYYSGRSLFDKNGNALPAISAWKDIYR